MHLSYGMHSFIGPKAFRSIDMHCMYWPELQVRDCASVVYLDYEDIHSTTEQPSSLTGFLHMLLITLLFLPSLLAVSAYSMLLLSSLQLRLPLLRHLPNALHPGFGRSSGSTLSFLQHWINSLDLIK